MVSFPDLMGIVMIASALPAVPVLWYVWPEREKPGVTWFVRSVVAGSFAGITFGLVVLINDRGLILGLFHAFSFVVVMTIVCWLLFVVEYVHRQSVPRIAVGGLFVVPVVAQLILWSDPASNVIVADAALTNLSVLRITWGPARWLNTGYGLLLAVAVVGILVGEWLTSAGDRRRQTGLMLAATGIGMIGGLEETFGLGPALLPHTIGPVSVNKIFATTNSVPVAFVLSTGLFAYALREYRFLQLGAIGRERVVETLQDPVVATDDEGTIMDANPAARRLVDRERLVGQQVRAAFSDHPDLRACLTADGPNTLEIAVDDEIRSYDPTVLPVEYGRGGTGQLLVLRDVTVQKRRESELELFSTILARVVRHNLRNSLSIIKMNAGRIETRQDGTDGAAIIESEADKLLDKTEKAREIETIVTTELETGAVDLAAVVEDVVSTYRREFPDATIELDVTEATVLAHPSVGAAIENAVENAIVHHDGRPTVTVTTTQDQESVTLVVEDDGPGIPQVEIDVLEDEGETALEHGSGVGLWLMKWAVEESGGTLGIERTEDGTRVEMTFRRARTTVPDRTADQRPQP